ncbi:MAG: GtrA-like protein [Caulobacteraceae bacterium]|jgi:putative flippase GtrA|nr:GtrA-like protein [Caulobacteraceae bacterium]
MAKLWTVLGECPLPLKFTFVSALGFAADATVLHLLMEAGATPAWARVVSLLCAMQVTFLVNGLLVFRCLDRARPWRQWAAYMLAHGLGNFCNYWIFVTLVSAHRSPLSAPLAALAVSSVLAWAINYAGARYFVFRKTREISDRVRPLSVHPHGGHGPA